MPRSPGAVNEERYSSAVWDATWVAAGIRRLAGLVSLGAGTYKTANYSVVVIRESRKQKRKQFLRKYEKSFASLA